MSPRARMVAALAPAVLAGCAVGPNYRPPAPLPAAQGGFVEGRASVTLDPGPASSQWWRMFDDPVLDRLIADALAHNTDVRQAAANLRRARGELAEQRAGLLPTTDVSASYSRNRVGADNGGGSAVTGGGGDHVDFNYYRAGFDASYEVDVFGRVSRSIEAAGGDAEAQAAELDAVRISVVAQVAQSYADACGNANQAAVARETARLQNDTRELTQRLLDAGRGTQRDVDQAIVLVERANAQVPQFEAERRAQLYALATLTGRAPADFDELAAQCRTVPKVRTAIPVGDGAALLARRPDVRRAERTLAADTARIGVATAALFPRISLFGSPNLGSTRFGHLGQSRAFSFSLGPAISWSFPNIAVARAQIRQARAGADASLAAFDGTVLTALRETEQALARYAAELERNAALARADAAAEDAAKLSRLRFDTGRDSFLDLLVTEQNRADAKAALAQSDTAVADAQVSLFKALGGGWENAPPVLDQTRR